MRGLLWALLLAAGGADQERAQLQQRLVAEKAAYDALAGRRESLLGALDDLERLARASTQRITDLERAHSRLQRRAEALRREEAEVDVELVEQQRRLAPRLVALYRLGRQDKLGLQLSSGNFATLLKRRRAMHALVEADARALDDLALVDGYQRQQRRRLERLDAGAQVALEALRREQTVGRARMTRFQESLAELSAEQSRRSRVVSELESAERELAAMVTELAGPSTAASDPGVFRALKGRLPMPARGVVEVGFGKVVNPRFNTVTVQKGIDVRAPAGADVVAIAAGTIAYSGWLKGYGNLLIVDHGEGYHSLYAHLGQALAEVGQAVTQGAVVGEVGDTGSLKGSYLYFELRKQGQAVDPLPWLQPDLD
jgi:septal ring factor EnvC (AmiA/AmiB activator)